jgi:plastocyanin
VARPAAPTAIVARDDHFDPVCVAVAPGSTVTLVVRNAGHHPHNLTLADESRAHVAVDAGQAGFVTATVGSADVRFSCTIHPGMSGVLRVDRPGPG